MKGKKHQKSTRVATISLILMMIGIFSLYFVQANTMVNTFAKSGIASIGVYHAIMTALCVNVIIGVMRVSAKSKTNDSDLLLSLPLSRADIIISKTLNIYLFDLFFDVVLLLPYIILYMVYTAFNWWILISGLVVMFLLPLLSIGISYVLDFLITRLFNRFKSSSLIKSLITVAIYLFVFALLMLKTFTYGMQDASHLNEYFSDRFFTYNFYKILLEKDILSIVIGACVIFIPFVLGMVLYCLNFGKILQGYVPKSHECKFNSPKNQSAGLLRKELSSFVTTPAWIVNTIIGPLFIMVVSVLVSIFGMDKLVGGFGVKLDKSLVAPILTLIFCVFTAMTQISCSSISLEGKHLWILKSSPISVKKLLFAKSVMPVVFIEPFILIGTILLALSLKLSFIGSLMLFFAPTFLTIGFGFFGVFINLYLPVLDAEDEVKVVKQSLAVLVCLLFGIVISVIPIILIQIFKSLSISAICLISISIFFIFMCISILLLFVLGEKKFAKL